MHTLLIWAISCLGTFQTSGLRSRDQRLRKMGQYLCESHLLQMLFEGGGDCADLHQHTPHIILGIRLPTTQEIPNAARSQRAPSNPRCISLPIWPLAGGGRSPGAQKYTFLRLKLEITTARFEVHRAKKPAFQPAPEHTSFNFSLHRARIKLEPRRVRSPFTACRRQDVGLAVGAFN